MWRAIAIVSVITIFSMGCYETPYEKETHQTIYLNPDGSLSWVVLERDIRGGPDFEEELLSAFERGEHTIATAFEALDPVALDCTMLRRESPFVVYTSADFPALDEVFQNLYEQLGVRNHAVLERAGEVTRFHWTVWHEESSTLSWNEELLSLLDEDEFRIVLTEGKFVDAEGFEIVDDGTVAIPSEGNDEDEEEETESDEVYSLTWVTEEDSSTP
jgi:hypothetical protein